MNLRNKKISIIIAIVLAVAIIGTLIGFSISGYVYYMGPFKQLGIEKIRWTYSTERTNEIIFYGPSNFARWWNMEEDMADYGYVVQNHAFGGSVDRDLIEQAEYLIYPYQPRVVFIQTGSNDYAEGVDFKTVKQNKLTLYGELAKNLPDTQFIIMGGLPLPGRPQFRERTAEVNEFVKEYCQTHERFWYVDSNPAILGDDGQPILEYFEKDGIHLNQKGHDAWTPLMIEALQEAGIKKDIT